MECENATRPIKLEVDMQITLLASTKAQAKLYAWSALQWLASSFRQTTIKEFENATHACKLEFCLDVCFLDIEVHALRSEAHVCDTRVS